jgi:hypothetical protein
MVSTSTREQPERQEKQSSQATMLVNMLLALFLIYFVMAALFESLLYPLSIVTSIVFSFIGVFWFFALTGTTISIMAMIGLLVVPWWLLRHRSHALVPALMGILLLGSVGGFAVDSGLRAISGRSEAVRTGSAVTLYSGLLASKDGPGCGYWSAEAAKAARRDRHKPLHRVVLDRLGDKPVSHWMSIVGCKLPQVVYPPPYALYWLVESPNVRAKIDADPRRDRINAIYHRVARWERKAYSALTLVILLAVAMVCLRLWRGKAPLLGMLVVAWIASFWAVHAVFEIQGRYFLGMLLLAPLLCALALRNGQAPRPGTSARDRFAERPD